MVTSIGMQTGRGRDSQLLLLYFAKRENITLRGPTGDPPEHLQPALRHQVQGEKVLVVRSIGDIKHLSVLSEIILHSADMVCEWITLPAVSDTV